MKGSKIKISARNWCQGCDAELPAGTLVVLRREFSAPFLGAPISKTPAIRYYCGRCN